MTGQRSSDKSKRRLPAPNVRDGSGRRVRINDLPFVAYGLVCGHYGRAYGIRYHDLVWCDSCGETRRVVSVNS